MVERALDRGREHWWIAHYRAAGCPLTNATDGGEGAVGYRHTDEARRQMAAMATGKKRGPHTPAHREAIAEAQRQRVRHPYQWGHGHSDAAKKHIGDAHRGKNRASRPDAVKAKIAATLKGRSHSAERRENIARGRWKERPP
jgi:hypothetical protein